MTEEGERSPRDEDEEAAEDAEVLVWNGLVAKPTPAASAPSAPEDVKKAPFPGPFEVAGAGFEPATSGL